MELAVYITMVTQALMETLAMVSASLCIGLCIGLPIGGGLYWFSKAGFNAKPWIYWPIHVLINSLRSVPFIILMVLLIPLSRLIVGKAIGTMSAIVPMSIGSIILMARMAEETLLNMPRSVIEVGYCFGASSSQVIRQIMLPEAVPQLVQGITNIAITLVAYSAMAGAIGGGGLGNLAITYGYQRYEMGLMVAIVVILIILVQVIQSLGDFMYKRLKH